MSYIEEREELLHLAGLFRELQSTARPGTKSHDTYAAKLRAAQDRMVIARIRRGR